MTKRVAAYTKTIFMSWLVVILSWSLWGCTPAIKKNEISGGVTYIRKTDISIYLSKRTYLVHVPKGYASKTPLPVVLALHGAFSTARRFEEETGLSQLADEENFIAVYPNGLGILGFLQHWNAGFCCGRAASIQLDDTGFLEYIIKDLSSLLNVDKRRIYVVGFSNGGMLAHLFAAQRPENVTAVAVVSASIGAKNAIDAPIMRIPQSKTAIPLMIIHGTNDSVIPYQGGKGNRELWYPPVEESVEFWVRTNACSHLDQHKLFDGRVTLNMWTDCGGESMVWLYSIAGWGHMWPRKGISGETEIGQLPNGFDATLLIWEFLKRFIKEK